MDPGVDMGEDVDADDKVKPEGGMGGVGPTEDGTQLPGLPDVGPPHLRGRVAAGAVEVLHGDARHGGGGVDAVVAAGGAQGGGLLEEEAGAAAKVEDAGPGGKDVFVLEDLHKAPRLGPGMGVATGGIVVGTGVRAISLSGGDDETGGHGGMGGTGGT